MASLRILTPDSTTNYIKNPSLRYDTTGWTGKGATISRSFERARFGFASLKIVTAGTILAEGAYYRVNWLSGIQSPLTASVYLRGTGKVRIRLIDNTAEYVSQPIFLTDQRWTRMIVTGRCSGGNDVRLVIETADVLAKAITIYADGAQIEPKVYETTYCDGDQPGCRWSLIQHGSLSTRSAYTRKGGRWVSIVGPGCNNEDLYVTVVGGMGVAPLVNNIQLYADAPGSYYQNTKVMNRTITMVFYAKSPDLRGKLEKSLDSLHALRQGLYDLIRPDKTSGGEEFLIEYQDGDFPVYINVRYEAGLEGEWDIRNRWVQSFPVRFLAVSPFLSDDSYETASLSLSNRIPVNYAMAMVNGEWTSMNGGMNNVITEMVIGKRGEVYACGIFTRSNNSASAIDPMIYSNSIAYWDGTQWNKLGSGANQRVDAVAIAPNGDIYAGGAFTSVGGVACNYIAKWNGSVWSALGTGLNAACQGIKVAPNGDVYAVGNFTTAGGAAAYYCARWDGTSWHSLGNTLGLNNVAYRVDISLDGTEVVIGGSFTDEFGSPGALTLNRIALYLPSTNYFYELGDGFDNLVLCAKFMPDGSIYASGDFTLSGTNPMLRISRWNGVAWHDVGAGADGRVRKFDVDGLGNIIAVGSFTRIGSVDSFGIALYNGTSWVNPAISLQTIAYSVILDAYSNIFLGPGDIFSTIARTTSVDVAGTAETYPILYISGPCTFRWLYNKTTGRHVYADLEIMSNEEVILDFSTGKMLNSVRGDVSYAILPGSDLRSFTLLPGINELSLLITNDVAAACRVYYAPRHWSADAMVEGAGL